MKKSALFLGMSLWLGLQLSCPAQLTVTNNLRYWFRADAITGLNSGDPVSLWEDSSTNGFDASQATASFQPIWISSDARAGGMPVVRFDGTDDRMFAPGTFSTTSLTIFAVVNYDDYFPGERFALNLRPTTPLDNAFLRARDINSQPRFSAGFGSDQVNPVVPEANGTNRFIVHTLVNAGGIEQVSYFTNAVLIGTTNHPLSATYTNLLLGAEFHATLGAANFLDGDIAEIIIFDSALNNVERQTVHEYLFAKYAIPEPSALLLTTLALLCFSAARRRW